MAPSPDLWALALFFGMPFVLGLLGLHRGGQILSRAYRGTERDDVVAELGPGPAPPDRSARERLLIGGALFVGGALLVLQAGRWLFRLL
jgi:hypothetical protein